MERVKPNPKQQGSPKQKRLTSECITFPKAQRFREVFIKGLVWTCDLVMRLTAIPHRVAYIGRRITQLYGKMHGELHEVLSLAYNLVMTC